jgi:hypothetical protein
MNFMLWPEDELNESKHVARVNYIVYTSSVWR